MTKKLVTVKKVTDKVLLLKIRKQREVGYISEFNLDMLLDLVSLLSGWGFEVSYVQKGCCVGKG